MKNNTQELILEFEPYNRYWKTKYKHELWLTDEWKEFIEKFYVTGYVIHDNSNLL